LAESHTVKCVIHHTKTQAARHEIPWLFFVLVPLAVIAALGFTSRAALGPQPVTSIIAAIPLGSSTRSSARIPLFTSQLPESPISLPEILPQTPLVAPVVDDETRPFEMAHIPPLRLPAPPLETTPPPGETLPRPFGAPRTDKRRSSEGMGKKWTPIRTAYIIGGRRVDVDYGSSSPPPKAAPNAARRGLERKSDHDIPETALPALPFLVDLDKTHQSEPWMTARTYGRLIDEKGELSQSAQMELLDMSSSWVDGPLPRHKFAVIDISVPQQCGRCKDAELVGRAKGKLCVVCWALRCPACSSLDELECPGSTARGSSHAGECSHAGSSHAGLK